LGHFPSGSGYRNPQIRDGLLPFGRRIVLSIRCSGFNEFLTEEGPLVDADFRRGYDLRSKHVCVNTASGLGDYPDGAAIARACFVVTPDHAVFDDHFGGVNFSINRDGSPHDRDKDLWYGTAFALFGLAKCAIIWIIQRLTRGRRGSRHLAIPLPSGWYSAKASTDWQTRDLRLFQNPHMHLLEASVAAYRATKAAIHKARIPGTDASIRNAPAG